MNKILAPVTAVIVLTGLFSCTESIDNKLASPGSQPSVAAVRELPGQASVSELILEFDEVTSEHLIRFAEADRLDADKIREAFPDTRSETPALASLLCLERVFPDAGPWEERHRAAGLHQFFKATFRESLPATRAEEEMREVPGVIHTERIPRIKPCAVNLPFNDPYAKRYQWHLYNDGSLAQGFVKGCDINVVPVWEDFGAGSSEVIVSVVDDGIFYNHPDLKGVVIPAGPEGSKNFVDASSSGVEYDPYKIVPGDHGTHVAGIIGAINDNGTGACGIAGGNNGSGGVRLLSCQIFQDNPKDPKHPFGGNTAQAIVWGADHGAVISQNSWGYDYENENQARYGQTPQSMKRAIDYFRLNAGTDANGNQTGPMKGGVVIFAAGNDGWAYGQPADYEPVIAVGATGPDGKRATYSNFGNWVDLCAPGGEADRINANGLSYILSLATQESGNYLLMCGTSMACPMVSGVAALIVSVLGGPGFTNENLEEILLNSGNPDIISPDDKVGPMVDAYKAISTNVGERVFFETDYQDDFQIATGQEVDVHYDITDKDGSKFIISLQSDESVRLVETSSNGCTLHFVSTEEHVGKHTARLTARRANNTSGTLDLSYVIYVNQAPVIRLEWQGDEELKWFEKREIPVTAADPEGRKDISWELQCTPEGAARLSGSGSEAVVTLGSGKGDVEGDCVARLIATDWLGAAKDTTLRFKVRPNQAPVVKQPIADILLSGSGDRVSLEVEKYFTDPDGETLSFGFDNENESVVTVANGGGQFFIRGGQEGVSSVTLTAKDGLGKTCGSSFRVGVYNDAKGPTAYPNPVRDNLYIRIGAEKDVQLTLYSEMGVKVFDRTQKASIFNPFQADLTQLAPGRYSAKISVDGKVYDKQIIKL